MTPNSGFAPTNTQPNIIGGQMPFGQGGNPFQGILSGTAGLAQQYGQSYNNALQQNQALYSNILGGYQQTMANQTSAQNAIAGGYNQLYNNVLGGIQGIGASQSQAISDVYAQQSGSLGQSMINRGLGNTTVSDTMQRGLGLDQQKAQIALSNQIAQLNAGYQSNLGMAGLNYGNQAAMQNTALGSQQLNWMNSVQAQYPNAGDYYGLYHQQGQWQQAQADRALQAQLAARGQAGVGRATVGAPVPNRSVDSNSMFGGGGSMIAPMQPGGGGVMDPGVMNSAYATNNPSNTALGLDPYASVDPSVYNDAAASVDPSSMGYDYSQDWSSADSGSWF